MNINFSDLAELTLLILKHVEEMHGTDIHIDADFYWNVPLPDRYYPYNEPTTLDMGQLSEDWDELQQIQNGEKEPLSLFLGMACFSPPRDWRRGGIVTTD